MAPKLKHGDRVIIEIRSSEVFEGVVENISSESIELYNIHCPTTDTKYDGNMTFYRNEVVTISLIGDSPKSPEPTPNESVDSPKKITMHPDEFARLKQLTYDFIFIDTLGKRFDDAVQVLSDRESVAVVGLGSTFTRGKPLSLLLVADFKQVFIFDLLCLRELKGLREIFSSSFICKVVHGGGALFDCLYHQYRVEMQNVFDTQVMDTMISRDDNLDVRRNISECLMHHFNFPESLLSAAMDDAGDRMWQERPIIRSEKIKASQLVVYLLSLRDVLMTKVLQKYTNTIETEYQKYKQMSDIELLTKSMTLNSRT